MTAAWRFDWNLCGCSLSVLFLPRRKSRSREKNGGDCKLCESAVFHYTHYNESSESKSLLRAIESARQMSTNINMETESGGQLSREFLKDNLQTLWVNGILVLFRNSELGEFDVILMDIMMPVMNGYEATKMIRSLDREDAKTIPIIAMTANAFEEDKKMALASGMNDHVAKPIDMNVLLPTIMKYM